MHWQAAFFIFLISISHAFAQNNTTAYVLIPGIQNPVFTEIPFHRSYESDPILQYRPHFAHSLPVQILMTGIILTLVVVLFMHLIFTAQYHWRLAQANYILQISAVVTLLTSLIATLVLIFRSAISESQQWPFMLSYIAVDIPPLQEKSSSWTTAGIAAWLMMNATTSALIQVSIGSYLVTASA